ncbi:Unknown protein, partial [Striga hermonthica]
SSVFFSKNITREAQEQICAKMAGIQIHSSTRYLGLPMGIARSKKEAFDYILFVVRSRVANWRNKCLSKAGKEILIKA